MVKQTSAPDESRLYFPSWDRHVYSINKNSGTLIWGKNMNDALLMLD